MPSDDFIILIAGRTNVGKSTIFNRLTGTRDAITFDRCGVTRDAKFKEITIDGKRVTLIDSPGMFDYDEVDASLLDGISRNINELLVNANLILFVLDGDVGVTEYDKEIARILRKCGKSTITVINKSDKKKRIEQVYVESLELGFDETFKISAEHGHGIDELCQYISNRVTYEEESLATPPPEQEEIVKIAIIGRPNVGKSTLINRILGEDRQLVADFAGLTRESAEFDILFQEKRIKILDTAGIRRQNRVQDLLEQISVQNSRKSYRNADAVILMIDATTLRSGRIDRQDISLASDIIRCGKALVIAFNKVDKTPYTIGDTPHFIRRNFKQSLSQLKNIPYLFISALNRENIRVLSKPSESELLEGDTEHRTAAYLSVRQENVMKYSSTESTHQEADCEELRKNSIDVLLQTTLSIHNKQKIRIKTSVLNRWLADVAQSDMMQSASAKFKLKYMTQIGILPPTFLIFISNRNGLREDHKRFITNGFRKFFDLDDVPLNIVFRAEH